MNIKTRIVISICILIVAISFIGGAYYQNILDKEIIAKNNELEKENIELKEIIYIQMQPPVKYEDAYNWLDNAVAYHHYYKDPLVLTEDNMSAEAHLEFIEFYVLIKQQLQILEERWAD